MFRRLGRLSFANYLRLLQEKLEAAAQKVRGSYKTLSDGRATSGKVDGVMMAKRRKLNSLTSGKSKLDVRR